ncbi:hypothetical protein PC129_g7049 [Phytophthora cactorum]|uniref:Uncharacterized protein n=1 Tax=Phytophthora cactorum TaxID=29920 RepID=A0A8T1G3Q4_9STRA|nr:hypothetical protein Pcac1_g8030 [Phytophthora cactorum]KAG3112323.1 hypothetical protein PI125_g8322 [Phytophthora idaei]KAG2829606.1 hypothetical protein PC111_g7693 [Phytophthora cactorum]KAG2835539.1 hypothetical protein PC112_g5649 [Phytophthora cactorum]KAG2859160.1 hypothetical protein PC113_g9169 [Phytophthora cactorum]
MFVGICHGRKKTTTPATWSCQEREQPCSSKGARAPGLSDGETDGANPSANLQSSCKSPG